MPIQSKFQVYNASAGSGKTFTLVKEYLKILLKSEDIFAFQKVLAITFTNKAAEEMKQRVLLNLQNLSEGIETDISKELIAELDLNKEIIQERSKRILQAILQNYSAFSITTIDAFTHKIIRSFAFDLGLSQNFEVEMDNEQLLKEAIDMLISKIGVEEDLTSLLVEYSLEKTEDDKSWDITYDLLKFGKPLFNESQIPHFKKLSEKTLQDFASVKKKLIVTQKTLKKEFKRIGAEALDIIDNAGLEYKNFYRSLLPNHFKNVEKNHNKAKFFDSNTLKEKVENGEFYTKSASENVKTTIDGIAHLLVDLYHQSERCYQQYVLVNSALKSIVPLAVLNNINLEIDKIKEDNNIRLNSEFNLLIANEIQNQPAPFIYERIGEKFQHYFIDEMQDTSVLQWQNMIPLIENSLSQENTGLLLVGDGKQSIYRWRGSKPEQFIELANETSKENPFPISKDIKNLETNYRSYSKVVDFNNRFFKHITTFLENEDYNELYDKTANQLENNKTGGYVQVSLLEKEAEKEEDLLKYAKKTHEILQNLDSGFNLGEVCILVRRKKDGVVIANYLSEQQIEIVSSETLLLKNSKKVSFIINLFSWFINPSDKHLQFSIAEFLTNHLNITDSHKFIKKSVSLRFYEFFDSLSEFDININLESFESLSLFEKAEILVKEFRLMQENDAYVQFLLDEILVRQGKNDSLFDFIEYWELKKEKLSVNSTGNKNAVTIMTIHKSKGLEFPIVIFPCDLNMLEEKDSKFWLKDISDELNPFDEVLLSLNKDTKHINDQSLAYYEANKQKLHLDNYNLLYVALTRAVEQLYVITEKRVSKGSENLNYYSGLFILYIKEIGQWEEDKTDYHFGNPKRVSKPKEDDSSSESFEYINNNWQDCNLTLLASSSKLWDTNQGEAINYGNFIHELLAEIYTKEDVDFTLNRKQKEGLLSDKDVTELKEVIHQIINHKELQQYYTKDTVSFNEREIVDVDNQIIIPDKLVYLNSHEVAVIDYKTGAESPEHVQQLLKYEQVLKTMNVTIKKKLLIYIKDAIKVVEI